MIQIAICDDERPILDMMCVYIESFRQKYALELNVCLYSEGKNLLNSGEKYDIIFLDIGLGKENGIEIGKEIRKMDKKVKIIYVTAFTDHMKDAFCVHAFEYLTKPVSEEKVHKILLEAVTYDGTNVANSMTFQTKNGMVTLKVDEIMYFEYCKRSVLLYHENDSVYELPGEKISNIADKMKPYHFEVSHKSFVVNLCQVSFVKGYNIQLKSGKQVPLSQLYSKKFRQSMHEYLYTRI